MGWPIDIVWKGCELIGCWTHYVILTYNFTHDLELGPINGLSILWCKGWGVLSFSECLVLIVHNSSASLNRIKFWVRHNHSTNAPFSISASCAYQIRFYSKYNIDMEITASMLRLQRLATTTIYIDSVEGFLMKCSQRAIYYSLLFISCTNLGLWVPVLLTYDFPLSSFNLISISTFHLMCIEKNFFLKMGVSVVLFIMIKHVQ